jgi:hypothetical protein
MGSGCIVDLSSAHPSPMRTFVTSSSTSSSDVLGREASYLISALAPEMTHLAIKSLTSFDKYTPSSSPSSSLSSGKNSSSPLVVTLDPDPELSAATLVRLFVLKAPAAPVLDFRSLALAASNLSARASEAALSSLKWALTACSITHAGSTP